MKEGKGLTKEHTCRAHRHYNSVGMARGKGAGLGGGGQRGENGGTIIVSTIKIKVNKCNISLPLLMS